MKKIIISLIASLALVASTSFVSAGEKVSICHYTGTSNKPINYINVSVMALKAHLNHGDLLANPDGSCGSDGGGIPD